MSDAEASSMSQSDIAVRPTIFIVMDEHGDINFSSNNPGIDLPMAIAMVELAKQKMMATYFGVVKNEKVRTEAMRPSIQLPDGSFHRT